MGKKDETNEKQEMPKKGEGAGESKVEKKEKEREKRRLVGIVRIGRYDVDTSLPIERAFTKIPGIGKTLSKIIAQKTQERYGLDPKQKISALEEPQIKQLEEISLNVGKLGLPRYLLNNLKDFETGEDMHLVGNDLEFAVKQRVRHEQTIYTWRGYRHAHGKKVRGQHTRTTGRRGMTVGVLRKSVLAKQGGAKTPEAGEKTEKKAEKKEEKK